MWTYFENWLYYFLISPSYSFRNTWNNIRNKHFLVFLIHHICHPHKNRLLGQEELVDKYGVKCNFLEALTLRNSIPHPWRTMLTSRFPENVPFKHKMEINGKPFDVMHSNPKDWYRECVRKKTQPFTRQDSWDRELGTNVQSVTPKWKEIRTLLFRTMRDRNQVIIFSLKVAYRLIPCNKYLNKIRIRDSPLCQFCLAEDSISHFSCRCSLVQTLWSKLLQRCENHLDFYISAVKLNFSWV